MTLFTSRFAHASRTSPRESLTARLTACDEAARADVNSKPAYAALAKDAQIEGAWDIAVQALLNDAALLTRLGEVVKADARLVTAMRLAHKHELHDLLSSVQLARALQLFLRHRYAESFDMVIELLRGRTALEPMPPKQQLVAYGLLIEMSLMVDPGESARLCLDLASAYCRRVDIPMPLHLVATQVSVNLAQYVLSAPEMANSLHALSLPQGQRSALLREALSVLEARPPRSDERHLELMVGILDLQRTVIQALLSGDGRMLARAAGAWQARGVVDTMIDDNMRYEIAAAALLLGSVDLAGRVLAGRLGESRGGVSSMQMSLAIEHLQATVFAHAGQHERAAACYVNYAKRWAAHAPNMQLNVKRVVKTLGDIALQPDPIQGLSVPAYLARALDLLKACKGKPPSVAELAASVRVSERALREALREHTGKNPKQYLLDFQLDTAHALRHSEEGQNLTLRELAQRVGFTHPARFAAAYRARFGPAALTPKKPESPVVEPEIRSPPMTI